MVSKTVIMGFLLTEGMQVICRTHYKQNKTDLAYKNTCDVTFATEAPTNSLVKGPTIGGVRATQAKFVESVEKHDKMMNRRKAGKKKDPSGFGEVEELKLQIETLEGDVNYLKRKNRGTLVIFIVFYLITLVGLLLFL